MGPQQMGVINYIALYIRLNKVGKGYALSKLLLPCWCNLNVHILMLTHMGAWRTTEVMVFAMPPCARMCGPIKEHL